MKQRYVVIGVLGVSAVVAAIVLHGQDESADAARLVEHLRLGPGAVVAEIGAGSGSLTVAIARHVGPTGRVYTNELASNLRRLRDAVDRSGAANIEVVEGKAAATNLPDECCDALFMRDVYHHFGDMAAMNASLFRALKPGGRLAIIDFPPRGGASGGGRRSGGGGHGITPEAVTDELTAAGFAIVSSEDPPGRSFVVVAEKPAH